MGWIERSYECFGGGKPVGASFDTLPTSSLATGDDPATPLVQASKGEQIGGFAGQCHLSVGFGPLTQHSQLWCVTCSVTTATAELHHRTEWHSRSQEITFPYLRSRCPRDAHEHGGEATAGELFGAQGGRKVLHLAPMPNRTCRKRAVRRGRARGSSRKTSDSLGEP